MLLKYTGINTNTKFKIKYVYTLAFNCQSTISLETGLQAMYQNQ